MEKPLAGVYINQSASSYSRAFDSLTITKQSPVGNTYTVQRSVWFNRIRQGKLESSEYHMGCWIGIYEEKTKRFRDTKKLREYTYTPGKKKLHFDNRTYLKIK